MRIDLNDEGQLTLTPETNHELVVLCHIYEAVGGERAQVTTYCEDDGYIYATTDNTDETVLTSANGEEPTAVIRLFRGDR